MSDKKKDYRRKKPKLRLPLPDQYEKVHETKFDYKRSREKKNFKKIIEQELEEENINE
jgi:hypothetical protein